MHDRVSTDTDNHLHTHALNRYAAVPTADKLKADPRFTGSGVRIAFLDSGFYPHPDISNRIIAFHDIHGEEKTLHSQIEPKAHHWHGTQTVVSCAGSGQLSDGVYKGIASEAELVLVKVSRTGKISDDSIVAGLEWIKGNRQKYDIRILNISLGGDTNAATKDSRINQLCEELAASGVVITVASGNSSESCTVPPASSPSVITVGGYSDGNRLDKEAYDLYHSSFGKTADGNVKPELIAPAMYVAAPILPFTTDYGEAEVLSMLEAAPDFSFDVLLAEFWQDAGLTHDVLSLDTESARNVVGTSIRGRKIIAAHYQHVDGTSFAAPITASVIAQMLEANPLLSPAAIKHILITTAERIRSDRAIRQGYGVLNAKRAVELAASEKHTGDNKGFKAPVRIGEMVEFTFHDDHASSVNLVGDFNEWNRGSVPLKRTSNGIWTTSIQINGTQRLRYKLLIDNERWTEDPTHGMKEEDGFGGFHSVLEI